MIPALATLAAAVTAGIAIDLRRISSRGRRRAHANMYRRRLVRRLERRDVDHGYHELRARVKP
jgi:hypothetical protein